MSQDINVLGNQLCDVVQQIYHRGWSPGTGGNYSVIVAKNPLKILITQSGKNKKNVTIDDLVVVNKDGKAFLPDSGKPSAETLLHCEIAAQTTANAVLHTHSVWNTLLGRHFCKDGGFHIEGFEMQKGLQGNVSHEQKEFIPILANSQDMPQLRLQVRQLLVMSPNIHCFLLAGHGLYTWGNNLDEAHRHVEVLEFLFECVGRQTSFIER